MCGARVSRAGPHLTLRNPQNPSSQTHGGERGPVCLAYGRSDVRGRDSLGGLRVTPLATAWDAGVSTCGQRACAQRSFRGDGFASGQAGLRCPVLVASLRGTAPRGTQPSNPRSVCGLTVTCARCRERLAGGTNSGRGLEGLRLSGSSSNNDRFSPVYLLDLTFVSVSQFPRRLLSGSEEGACTPHRPHRPRESRAPSSRTHVSEQVPCGPDKWNSFNI